MASKKACCNGCPEFGGVGSPPRYCSYSCSDVRLARLDDHFAHHRFVKELYLKSGVYVSPSSIMKYSKMIKELL